MSDGPIKRTLEVEPEPLDDIILGEDDEDAAAAKPQKPAPPPMKQPSRSPPPPPAAAKAAGSVPPKGARIGSDPGTASGSVAPPPADSPSKPPPKKPSSGKMKAAAESSGDTKKRAKMTLRIPDDEVSRPQLPATTPMGGVPAVSTSASGSRPPPAAQCTTTDPLYSPPTATCELASSFPATPSEKTSRPSMCPPGCTRPA